VTVLASLATGMWVELALLLLCCRAGAGLGSCSDEGQAVAPGVWPDLPIVGLGGGLQALRVRPGRKLHMPPARGTEQMASEGTRGGGGGGSQKRSAEGSPDVWILAHREDLTPPPPCVQYVRPPAYNGFGWEAVRRCERLQRGVHLAYPVLLGRPGLRKTPSILTLSPIHFPPPPPLATSRRTCTGQRPQLAGPFSGDAPQPACAVSGYPHGVARPRVASRAGRSTRGFRSGRRTALRGVGGRFFNRLDLIHK
jgi:hypothetical protein